MRSLFRPVLAVAIGALAAQCIDPSPTGPHPITNLPRQLTGAENSLVVADNRFAFSLFGAIARQASPNSNLFISPLSAAMALAMAYNGAAGTTQAEMQRTLELGGMTLDEVNRSYHGLIGLLGGLDAQVAFTLANSVWYRQGLVLSQGFLDATRTYFDAQVQGLDFASPAAAPTINGWVSEKTHGKIPAIVADPIPDSVVAYLINAIYFKGTWTTQFDKSQTQPGPFTLLHGVTTSVPMMTYGRPAKVGVRWDPGVTILDLAYGGGAFSMTILLPSDAAGIDSLTHALTQERWNAWTAALDAPSLTVYLPRFTLTYELEMSGVLKALGMVSAFCDPGPADFTAMNPSGQLCITHVKHKATVDVNEEGTEAAAATSVEVGVTSLPPRVMVNHPFLFVIRERLSGTILFLGRVMNPATS